MRFRPADLLPYFPVAVLFSAATFYVSGDTWALASGAYNALQCLQAGKAPCGPGVAHFPLFQYLFAVPALALGALPAQVPKILAASSLAFGALAIFVFWKVGARMGGVRGGHLALGVLFTGYGIFYFFSSFNEMGAFALFAALAAAVLWRSSWPVVVILAFLCTVTKDIAAPFVVAFWAIAWMAREWPFDLRSRSKAMLLEVLPVIGAVAAGMAANAAFNWFRYGTLTNQMLLNPDFQTPAGAVSVYFAMLFLSPAGGLLYVWLSLALFVIAAVVAMRKNDGDLAVIAAAVGVQLVATLGLAFWWSPFGWYAWGPRLSLPYLGAVAVLVLSRGAGLLPLLHAGRRGVAAACVAAVLFASMLPNALALVAHDKYFARMFAPGTMERLAGPHAGNLGAVGRDVFMFTSMQNYARAVIVPTTLDLARGHAWILLLTAAYAALAAWRICLSSRR